MRMLDLIIKKRNGLELTDDEIKFMISDYVSGKIPDYQMSAMLMAIYFKGCSDAETYRLTMAMAHSGEILSLNDIHGIKVDKHSTGGVGDKVSLVVAPVAAACGVPVAKMSGRGLGFTGGTIDKLESIPGFRTELSENEFIDNVNAHGISIMGQTADLAPADKLLYALRDVTGTVDNMSLIASSIMSKKIAAGADAIVLDVTCGSGAFMKDEEKAHLLAQKMVDIGKAAGINTRAVITDMDEPLGNKIGNSLEVIEAIETLSGNGPRDVNEVCMAIAAQMLLAGQITDDESEAYAMVRDSIASGKALGKFRELVKIQNGDISVIDDTDKFDKAPVTVDVFSPEEGFVSAIQCERAGECVKILGGGRSEKGQKIDLTVGIELLKKVGDPAEKGEKIAVIYSGSEEKAVEAAGQLADSYIFSKYRPEEKKLIKDIVRQ